MTTKEILKNLFKNEFSDELIEELASKSLIFPVVKGQNIIKKGVPFNYMVIVLSGIMKVTRRDGEGNEHVLFYLKEGEPCSESLLACNGDQSSEVDLIAESDGVILLIPNKLLDPLMEKYPDWRKYVLKNLAFRIKEFLNTLDTITFKNLDERLIKYLKDKSEVFGSKEIKITHQNIANDLATSRVVVSRLLKMLERKGLIKLYRNRIELVDL